MNIIARKSSLYTTVNYLNRVFKNNFIDGAFFEVVMTKDDQIVVFNPIFSNDITIQTIQNSTFAQIKSEDILFLKDALSYFVGTDKKVIIDVIPLFHPPITNENAEEISSKNKDYISKVASIIESAGPLKSYIASIDQKLIFHMKNILDGIKIGLIFYPDNLSYVDVDFYVFSMKGLNNSILEEQISRGKEVMISIADCNDLSIMLDYYLENNLHSKDIKSLTHVSFINNYPAIFYQVFKDL